MKQLFSLTILTTILFSCSPKIRTTITSKQPLLSYNEPVLVLRQDESFDNNGIEVGTVKAGDNGMSSNCSYNELIEILTQTAKLNGANILKITEHKTPDLWSTCDRITAKIYRVSDFRKYEKEIVWSATRKLTWDDFKGNPKPISNTNVAAVSYCGFGFQSNRVTMFKKLKIYSKTIFDCKLSWVRPDQIERKDLLEHEQTHFDLCEVYSRILRKKIEEKNLTVFNLNNEADAIFKEIYALYLDRQELYEKETNYGLDRQKQIEWTIKVEKELTELNAYS
jgi:hypothetical protein